MASRGETLERRLEGRSSGSAPKQKPGVLRKTSRKIIRNYREVVEKPFEANRCYSSSGRMTGEVYKQNALCNKE